MGEMGKIVPDPKNEDIFWCCRLSQMKLRASLGDMVSSVGLRWCRRFCINGKEMMGKCGRPGNTVCIGEWGDYSGFITSSKLPVYEPHPLMDSPK